MSAPPSIALAMMAMRLANLRIYGWAGPFVVQRRGWHIIDRRESGATGEFHRILDRISAGEAP